jgi:ribose transport system substrate-binding protein
MNNKDKRALNLQMLTKRVERHLIDRRSFLKGAVALGLTASSAMLLYQAYGSGPSGAGTALAQGGNLIKRLPEFRRKLPNNMYNGWLPTAGKKAMFIANDLARADVMHISETFQQELEDPVGGGMEYTAVDSGSDLAAEQDHIEMAISGGYSIILLAPLDPAGSSPGVTQAREAGIPVCNWADDSVRRPTYKEGYNYYRVGWLAAEHMSNALGSGASVVGAVGDENTPSGRDRRKGFEDGAAQFGLSVAAFESGHGWTRDGGYDMGQGLLSRFPDFQGMYGGNDQAALGFHDAAAEAGRREGMVIAGGDGLKAGQDGVNDRSLDMTVAIRRGLGPQAANFVYIALALLRGGVHGDAFELAHMFNTITVTKENIGLLRVSPV